MAGPTFPLWYLRGLISMKFNNLLRCFLLVPLFAIASGCGGGGSSSATATLVSLTVSPAKATLSTGAVLQLSAVGSYSDNSTQDLTASVNWVSSAATIASVNDATGSKGVVTALSAGTSTITATLGTFTASSNLTVVGSTLASIVITPADPTLTVGSVQQFLATGSYADASTQDLTASVSWKSSASAVATVSDAAATKGAATALAAGSTVITATLGAVSGSTTLTVNGTSSVLKNVMSITVNGSLCSSATSSGYLNKPCVSVTVCNPGSTTTCQTVNDILLDTGSYGLRIFKSALSALTLTQVSNASGSLAGCVQFADGSALWGPIQLANVQLGNETAVQIPIQVIDSSFGRRPSACSGADATPAAAGFAGILGVGVFTEDCGSTCVNNAANGLYYSCTGSSCSGSALALANQVANPVAKLLQDNNGLIVQLPAVSLGGAASASGSLILGIGTQTNNTLSSPTVFPTDQSGEFTTVFNGVSSASFLDTGSNGLFFATSSSLLPACASSDSFWYCPGATTQFSATNVGSSGSPSAAVQFAVGNFTTLTNSSNNVFREIAGTSSFGFDWGLPFYFGRNVYVGFEGKSGLGSTGPYVAY
jgi:hypothetical protein